MSTLITWWEYDELLDHLQGRDDIWLRNDENHSIWLRQLDGTGCCALVFSDEIPAAIPMRSVDVYPVEWSQSECEDYLRELLSSWTEYGRRIQTEVHLQKTLKLPANQCEDVALTLCAMDHGDPIKDPETKAPPVQEEMFDPPGWMPPNWVHRFVDPLHVGVWNIRVTPSQDGTLKLRRMGGQLSVEISLINPQGESVPRLKGFVMPIAGSIEQAIAHITRQKEQDAQTDCTESELVEDVHVLQEDVRVAANGEPSSER